VSTVTPLAVRMPDHPEGVDPGVYEGIIAALKADRPATFAASVAQFAGPSDGVSPELSDLDRAAVPARLEVPLRQRDTWLMAAGFAPVYGDRSIDDPSFEAVRFAIDVTMEAHKPFPAFAIDRHWNVVASNRALPELYVGVDPKLLEPPVNVLRLSLHPSGLAPRILNLQQWSEHLLGRLRRELESTADPRLESLHEEALAYGARPRRTRSTRRCRLRWPFRYRSTRSSASFRF
jgi:hypothetical protein